MDVKMKQYEKWALDYAQKFNKKDQWEFYIIAKDAYLEGFKQGQDTPSELANTTILVELSSNQIGG